MRLIAVLGALVVAGSVLAPASAQVATPVPLLRLTNVATLTQPVAMAARAGDDTLYVAEQGGYIRAIRDGVVDPEPVLDLSDEVSGGFEQGLIGLAFTPETGEYLYVSITDVEGDTHILEYAFPDGEVDESTRRELLFWQQPFDNHNGGTLRFGPDGYLYIGLGDGGSAGDPEFNGQDLTSLLGKMLRIDPRGAEPYAIPADNPFVDDPEARDEIWAYGLRNPWGFSFDRETGDLWIGDVGQSLWEEVDFQAAGSAGGQNYGWNQMEGNHPYEDGVEPDNHTPPIYEYSHAQGCSITGGFVYRGSNIPSLQGRYVFSDFCTARIWVLGDLLGERFALETGTAAALITAFGEGGDGELYVMTLTGDVSRIDPLF